MESYRDVTYIACIDRRPLPRASPSDRATWGWGTAWGGGLKAGARWRGPDS